MPAQVVVGLDVAKAQWDIALRLTGERWAVTNDDAGIALLVTRLQESAPQLMVLEATRSYERAVVAALVGVAPLEPGSRHPPQQSDDLGRARPRAGHW
jgi:hypothetical protein